MNQSLVFLLCMATLPVFPCRAAFFFPLWARLCQGLCYCLFWGNRNWFQSKSDKMALHVSTGNYRLTCQTVKSSGLKTGKGGEWKTLKRVGYKIKAFFFKNSALYHLQKNSEWSHFLLCLTSKQWHGRHFPFLWQPGKPRQYIQHWAASCFKKAWGKDLPAAARSVSRRKGPGCVQPPSSQGGSQLELKWCELSLPLSVYDSLCLFTNILQTNHCAV